MRKIVSVIIVLIMCISLVGCAEDAYEPVTAPESGVVSSDEEIISSVETEETTSAITTEETTVSETTVPETTVTTTVETTTTVPTTAEVTTTTPATTTTVPTTTEVVTTTEVPTTAFSVEETSLTMYASNSVNVRSGPSTDYDRIGHLDTNDEVTVTGIASTGWYRIDYKGTVGYVSNNYLSDEKVAVTTTAAESSSSSTTTATTTKTISSLRDALNSITLSPKETGFSDIDDYIDDLLSSITTSNMDTYDKLKACYDYLIDYMTYGQQEDLFWYWLYYGEYGGGYLALLEGVGVCDDYSAAYCMLANKIGVPMTVVSGQTHKASGGYTGHAWCELDMGNGTVYIFDPQIEDSIAGRQDGKVSYLRFGKTTEELADKYIKY